MNNFGRNFRVTIFGESHGGGNGRGESAGKQSGSDPNKVSESGGGMLGVVMDGVPPGINLSIQDFEPDLARRRSSGGSNGSDGWGRGRWSSVTGDETLDLMVYIIGAVGSANLILVLLHRRRKRKTHG